MMKLVMMELPADSPVSSDPALVWANCQSARLSGPGWNRHRHHKTIIMTIITTGCFFSWYPPKKLKYGKPRVGESTLT